MSSIPFRANAYAPLTSRAVPPLASPVEQTNSTAAPAQSPTPAVGSQSKQFVEENNKLRDQGIARVTMLDPTEQDSDLMERMADGSCSRHISKKTMGSLVCCLGNTKPAPLPPLKLTTDGQIISAQDGLDISKMDQSEVQSEVTTHPDTDIGKKRLVGRSIGSLVAK
jgi:hypothetical protein